MATDAEVLAVLRIKQAAYEGAGMTEHVKNVKARIAQLEKPVRAAPAAAPLVKVGAGETIIPVKKVAVKKTAKKRK